jgi:hypothetical protein
MLPLPLARATRGRSMVAWIRWLDAHTLWAFNAQAELSQHRGTGMAGD